MQKTAKVFTSHRSQAIRLPKEFEFKASEVLIRKDGDEVILSVRPKDWSAYLIAGPVASEDSMSGLEDTPLSPERQAQLNAYAQRQGQDPAAALDGILASVLEPEQLDFEEAVDGIRQGYDDVRAGRTQPADEMFEEMRMKHALPR